MERRAGIYSGTFDPIHPGHVAFAEEAMRVCCLDEVIFIPEQKPRGKDHVTNISHRIALIEYATEAIAGLRVVRLASEQFNVEQTLPELHQAFGDSSLTLLVGSDTVRTFLYRWEGLDTLLTDVSLAIGVRSNDSPDEITTIMSQLEHDYGIPIDYTLIFTQEADMASSQIRNGAADMSRLHPGMRAYIQEHQLYTQQD
jgi:nicotinate-nucleotide adenylyltransferase